MKKHLLFLVSCACLFLAVSASSQIEKKYAGKNLTTLPLWVQYMYQENADPELVINAYTEYYALNNFVKNQHTQYYKRWMRTIARDRPVPVDSINRIIYEESKKKYLEKSAQLNQTRSSSQWEAIGPFDWDHEAASRSYAPGAAHVYTVEQSISNPDYLYAGAATCGIWRSSDHGMNWISVTSDFLSNTCTALEIDPTNHNIVYAEILSSIYKTTNGGVSWSPTGDSEFANLSLNIKDIRFHQANDRLFAATNDGLYISDDDAVNWDLIASGDYLEIEFHPTFDSIIYAVKYESDITKFMKSINGGDSFFESLTGWPMAIPALSEHQKRTEIAVSADNPNAVFALATGHANGGSGLYGVYISIDNGDSWTFQCCGPQPAGPPSATNINMMGWSDEGLDDGGQYYYDLAFDVSPTNADQIFVAGVNLWISEDGGSSFTCPAKWSHPHKPGYVHADIHDINFYEGTEEIWLCGDGGIFFSDDNGASFQRRMNGISGTDFWGFGIGFWEGDVMLGGTYHNGTLLKNKDTYINGWISTDGGDNVRGFVNPGKENQAYSDYNIKTLPSDRTIPISTRGFSNKPNATYTTGASSDLLFHPNNYNTWYTGSGTVLFKTEDDGLSFDSIYDFGANISSMDISYSDPNYLYVSTFPDWWATKKIYRSADGGMNWTEITPSTAILQNNRIWIPYDITIDALDPLKLWIARTSMYGTANYNGTTVYSSVNGGDTWTNISGSGLNGESPTNIIHQKGTDGGLYIGTRRGVYFRDNSMSDWVLYNTGLPVAIHSVRLIPYYRKNKIRNATNRSVWESPMNLNSDPIAMPSVNGFEVPCAGDSVYFRDHSIVSDDNVSYLWNFPGGIPETSTERNPVVVYQSFGTFDVSLTVTDNNGSDTRTMEDFISIQENCGLDDFNGNALNCTSNPDHMRVENVGWHTNTFTVSAWIKPNGIQPNYAGIFMNDGPAAGLNFRESNNTLGYHWPGGSWSWDSNLIVPPGEWSHVAMTVSPTSITIYLNGESAIHNVTPDSVLFNSFRIGSYQGWGSRNYSGLVDELTVWDKTLSEDEIRLARHLTQDPNEDNDIRAYYQFNRIDNIVVDKAGVLDGTLSGSASIENSFAPVAGGTSQILNINAAGNYVFEDADFELTFSAPSISGDLCISRLNHLPKIYPDGKESLSGAYWIVNNYGNNTFSGLSSIKFNNIGSITDSIAELDNIGILFKRNDNDDDELWQSIIDDNISISPGLSTSIEYTDASNITSFSQFTITRDSLPIDFAEINILHKDKSLIGSAGAKSKQVDIYGINQGIKLPVHSKNEIEQIDSPSSGLSTFDSDKNTIVFFGGFFWTALETFPESIEISGTSPNPSSISIGDTIYNDKSAILQFENSKGLIALPSFNASEIMEIDFPVAGMLIYNNGAKGTLQAYDGHQWKTLKAKSANYLTSNGSPADTPGLYIGNDEKDPNAIFQMEIEKKAWFIPNVRAEEIAEPIQGLLIFDPSFKSLLIHDGIKWNRLLWDE